MGDLLLTFCYQCYVACAEQLTTYFDYVAALGTYKAPNYGYLRSLFQSMLEDIGESDDGVFDWSIPKEEAVGI